MNVTAIIPARGGSKGVPLKNLRQVGGRSLVHRACDTALESGLVTETVVTSDSPEILEHVGKEYGPAVWRWLRPAELATDTASTDATMIDALQCCHRLPDLVVLLQPTVPLRRPGLVDDCIRRLLETEADSLLTAYRLHFVWRLMDWTEPPRWSSPYGDLKRRPRRQDLDKHLTYYAEDGAVFVSRTHLLTQTGARLGGKVEVFENERTVDIDTEADLALAEAMLSAREAVPA